MGKGNRTRALKYFDESNKFRDWRKLAQRKIDEINDFTYHNINNGVYKVGFATKQSVYEEELDRLFNALDQVEEMLEQKHLFAWK